MTKGADSFAAFDLAMSYLARKRCSQQEMRDYLARKCVSPDLIEQTLQKLIYYNYIDDKGLAKTHVEANAGVSGVRKLKFDLKRRGLSDSDIAQATSEVSEEEQIAAAAELVRKKAQGKERDLKLKNSLFRALLSRGFTPGVAKAALSKILNTEFDNYE